MRLLDAFCGAGGCSVGYQRAGFEVFGVDIKPQKNYPFEFHQADALEFITEHGREFDVIHTSPPCQVYSVMASFSNGTHPDLVGPTRTALEATGKPYVIENVPGAPLHNPIMLCGTMFGLDVVRHRLFETRPEIWFPPTQCHHLKKCAPQGSLPGANNYITVTGNFSGQVFAQKAMGIDWMTRAEIAQAIPPAYTEWLGRELLREMAISEVAYD